MGFLFGFRRRRPLTGRGLILVVLILVFGTFRTVNRQLAKAQAWEGVVETKDEAGGWGGFHFTNRDSDTDDRPTVTVRCDDGKVRTAPMLESAWHDIRPGDRVRKPAGEACVMRAR